MARRIGIFGGTFDPPHVGHLILGEEIRERFGLEQVYFVPCNEPPHKDRPDLTAARHRLAMVVAATLHNPAFVASPVEVNRPGKSYSIDTLKLLREELGQGVEMLFVSGIDSFLEIETWKDYRALLELCHFIVVSRPSHRFEEIPKRLPDWIVERTVDVRGDGTDPRPYLEGSAPEAGGHGRGPTAARVPPRIFLSDAVHVDVSSTEIRARIRQGRSIRYRVPAEVERYIEVHGLYRGAAQEAAS